MNQEQRIAFLKRKAEGAEQRAAEWSRRNEPWALGNLRIYQNMASRFWGEYYAAVRAAEGGGT